MGSPADASAAVNLGAALLQLQRPEEAAERFRHAIKLGETDLSTRGGAPAASLSLSPLSDTNKAKQGLEMAMRAQEHSQRH